MTRRIVVPVNESAQSERALPVAAALARRLGASIALVSAVGWPNWDYPGHAGYHESLMAPYPDLDAESIVVKSKSDAATAIRAVCGADDIICLGAGHTSAMSELLLRSVFFDLVRDFHGPVVAVGPHATMPDGAGRMLLSVIFAHEK